MAKLSYQIANGNMSRMELASRTGFVECGRGAVRPIKGEKLERGWREIHIPRSPAGYSSN
jgi:hypothetical protein